MTSRAWLFTINNPTEADVPDFATENWLNLVKLAIFQKERGEEGTDHLQGYITLSQPRRLAWMKSRLPRAHLEKRKGSHEQAVQYVIKEDTRIEDPVIFPSSVTLSSLQSLQATASTGVSRLNLMKMKIDSGATDLELADEDFETWVRHYRGLNAYRLLKSKPRNHEMHVSVYQGPTGTGKSRFAMENFPSAYWKQRSQWWDGYAGHEVVVIDEFYGWLPFDTLLRLCDRYPLLVETKGGQVQFEAKRVIITTNALPQSWYKSCYFPSFVRRVHEWHVFPVWGEHEIYTDYSEATLHMLNNN